MDNYREWWVQQREQGRPMGFRINSRGKGTLLSSSMRERISFEMKFPETGMKGKSQLCKSLEKNSPDRRQRLGVGARCAQTSRKRWVWPELIGWDWEWEGWAEWEAGRTLCRSRRSLLILRREVSASPFSYIISFNLFNKSGRWILWLPLLEKRKWESHGVQITFAGLHSQYRSKIYIWVWLQSHTSNHQAPMRSVKLFANTENLFSLPYMTWYKRMCSAILKFLATRNHWDSSKANV